MEALDNFRKALISLKEDMNNYNSARRILIGSTNEEYCEFVTRAILIGNVLGKKQGSNYGSWRSESNFEEIMNSSKLFPGMWDLQKKFGTWSLVSFDFYRLEGTIYYEVAVKLYPFNVPCVEVVLPASLLNDELYGMISTSVQGIKSTFTLIQKKIYNELTIINKTIS